MTDRPVDPGAAERAYCCYAWPVRYGDSGDRTFFVNQDGRVLWTKSPAYSGDDGPRPGAAFQSGGLDSILGKAAADAEGRDGNLWTDMDR